MTHNRHLLPEPGFTSRLPQPRYSRVAGDETRSGVSISISVWSKRLIRWLLDSVRLVGLRGSDTLRNASGPSHSHQRALHRTIPSTKPGYSGQKPNRQGQVSLLHDNVRPHDAENTKYGSPAVRMGDSLASSIFARPRSYWLSLFPLSAELLNGRQMSRKVISI